MLPPIPNPTEPATRTTNPWSYFLAGVIVTAIVLNGGLFLLKRIEQWRHPVRAIVVTEPDGREWVLDTRK